MSLGIDIEHPVPHVHTQNGLAEALIKRLQLIARTLLMKTKLPVSAWGYAILYVASLVRLRPVANNQYSSIQLVLDVPTLSHLDPRTAQCENKVRRIVHLQSIANQMPNAFNDATKVTKSHIPAANAHARTDVQNGQNNVPANDSSIASLERGRPLDSKDLAPQKRKSMAKMNPNEINGEPTIHNSNAYEEAQVLFKRENVIGETSTSELTTVPESQEISLNYTSTDELWNRNDMIIDIFAFSVATEIIKDDDIESCSIDECT
ncbi:unnamed protein product [Prunus brigantina]